MPGSTNDSLERFYARDRSEWRAWLEQHHAAAAGVWLVYYKRQTGKPGVAYDEAVEEALCFGWIDSRTNTLDNERSMQFFSPRKPKSPWAKSNKQRVEKLLQQGLIAPAGLKVIEAAKADGSWNVYDAIEALTIPEDFQAALAANETAQRNFTAFGNSIKKQILWWIESAKRPETRQKRIAEIVQAAAQNKNPLNYAANKKEREQNRS